MKRHTQFLFLLPFLMCMVFLQGLFAHEREGLTDHSRIKPLSDFCVTGIFELRAEKNKNAPVTYHTLNHEGGMKVRVVEVLGREEYAGEPGQWLYVLLTSPMWVDTGAWIKEYSKFLIFLPDSTPVYNFEE